MADRIVRSLRDIDSVDKLNDNLVEANDLITTKDGNIYIRRDEDYYKLTFKDELLSKINTNTKDINKNKNDISQNATDIINIKEDNAQQDKKIKNLSDVQSEHTNKLSNHESAIHILDDKNTKNEEDIEKNKQDIIATKESVSNNTKSINNLTAIITNENKTTVNDTGWQDIKLESGIIASNSSKSYPAPQYRILTINGVKTIQLKGVLKGIKKNGDIKLGTINANLKSTHHYTQCAIDSKMINTRLYVNFNNELHFVTSNYSDSELSNGDKSFAIDTQIIE
ncbi:tail fiber [Staphylococcus phage CSA13]|uniref:Tail fiber n=1 Tax=Staphylococcus phage CSA13 TaxID=2108359 RepID=A0A3S7JLQ7_9CAUD|nr:tail protein [Staphylococcus phage CSA13]AWD93111.1 tail fiber [Staphylococcus phage CSA13]